MNTFMPFQKSHQTVKVAFGIEVRKSCMSCQHCSEHYDKTIHCDHDNHEYMKHQAPCDNFILHSRYQKVGVNTSDTLSRPLDYIKWISVAYNLCRHSHAMYDQSKKFDGMFAFWKSLTQEERDAIYERALRVSQLSLSTQKKIFDVKL